jgi:hypothetical protein
VTVSRFSLTLTGAAVSADLWRVPPGHCQAAHENERKKHKHNGQIGQPLQNIIVIDFLFPRAGQGAE